jgi:hypothetical protein
VPELLAVEVDDSTEVVTAPDGKAVTDDCASADVDSAFETGGFVMVATRVSLVISFLLPDPDEHPASSTPQISAVTHAVLVLVVVTRTVAVVDDEVGWFGFIR